MALLVIIAEVPANSPLITARARGVGAFFIEDNPLSDRYAVPAPVPTARAALTASKACCFLSFILAIFSISS